MADGWGSGERGGRYAALLALGGGGIAIASLLFAGASGGPYLGADGVNGWVVVFAAGLFVSIVALPFGLEAALRRRLPDRDRRWELAMVAWACVAGAVLAIAIAIGFDTGTLAGAAALIAAIETGLVVATIGVWLLSG